MLTLLLLRHAKAEPQAGGGDFARPLSPRGREDATRLGAFLRDRSLGPDHALVSPSVRTMQTLEGLADTVGRAITHRLEAGLYNATADQIRQMIAGVSDAATLLVVGHNPGIMDLASALPSSGDPRELQAIRSRFPPCSLAVITFDQSGWSSAMRAGGRLDAFVTPEIGAG